MTQKQLLAWAKIEQPNLSMLIDLVGVGILSAKQARFLLVNRNANDAQIKYSVANLPVPREF